MLIETISMTDADAIAEAHEEYRRYLRVMQQQMPRGTFEFASAKWHYDPGDHRCPHDSWVHDLTISEPSSGERSELRTVEISIRLLGAYHDGWIDLQYYDVTAYSMQLASAGGALQHSHGDWLIDEFRMSNDLVVHEIVFQSGARWVISCRDMRYTWIEKPRLAA